MLYYDTGICPRCGSPLTGRLVPKNTDAMRFSLTGPIIYNPDPGEYNCACAECGVFWTGMPKLKNITLEEYDRLGDLWERTIDGSPTFTRKEEAEIAKDLYEDTLGIGNDSRNKNRALSTASKLITHEGRMLKRQGSGLIGDFAGILGIKSSGPDSDDLAETSENVDTPASPETEESSENQTYL